MILIYTPYQASFFYDEAHTFPEIKDCGTQRGRLALTADWLIEVYDPSLNYTVSTIEHWLIA